MTGDEEKIYDLIVRRFLAAFHPPYDYEETQVHTEIEGKCFIQGISVINPGWKNLYKGLRKKTREDPPLPVLNEGQTVTAAEARLLAKKTRPPQPYNKPAFFRPWNMQAGLWKMRN